VRDVIETDDRRIAFAHVCKLEPKRRYQRKDKRCVVVASTYNGMQMSGGVNCDPRLGIAKAIRAALNPDNAPRPARTFATMSPEERAEMQRLYGKK
jgi:hypothetical protein